MQNRHVIRSVNVTLGVEEALIKAHDEHLLELYSINFVSDEIRGNGEQLVSEGFSAFSPCLCMLAMATEGWLLGASETEVVAMITDHARPDNDGDVTFE